MRSFRAHQLFRRAHGNIALDHMRRLVDLVIAFVLLVISAPLMLAVALAIKAESSGPILVKETCIGLGGRRFRLLSFRTVLHDPDRTMPSWGRRATPLGEVLRYTRIEALPQLINVLCGEMSIIDPDGRSPSFLD